VRAFIFDTETTGLVKNSLIPLDNQPRVIEFFGHTVDDSTGEVLNEIEFLCNPGITIEPKITQITGIKPEDLVAQAPFSYYAPEVVEAIGNADAVVAHNLSFDMALIAADCARCGTELKWPPRLSLGALHEHLFGEPFKDAHRARTDVQALTKCFLELRKRGDV
jgi:DNA polymerase III epsilon subunit-like protein